jgi:mycothiol system anti-sigma-R factor
MKCDEVIRLMDGYLDGELDAITNQEIELHLRECKACQQAYETQRSLVHAIGTAAPYYKAPVELRERIQYSLRQEISTSRSQVANGSTRTVREANESRPRAAIFGSQWNWLALAAMIMVAAIIGVNWIPGHRAGSEQFLATQLIASHVRSLMANHLTDVASSDQHTVKPWLDAKLDFAPAVVDLQSEGFPLLGGRLDYLDNRPVAALVYQRRKHFINLFIWPVESGTSKTSETISRQGYQLVHWADSDFNYWAVSDVNNTDLQSFKDLFEKQLPRR